MSTLFYERTPFDILVRNFFQDASQFSPLADQKIPHPVDIYTDDKNLVFEIACTGIAKDDLEIQTQSNTLRVNVDRLDNILEKYLNHNLNKYFYFLILIYLL